MIKEGLQKRTLPITDRGTLGEHMYLSRQGSEWCTPAAILRRNYFENYSGKELFQEGRTNILGGLCEPRKREVTLDSQGGIGTRESRRETFC